MTAFLNVCVYRTRYTYGVAPCVKACLRSPASVTDLGIGHTYNRECIGS